MSVTLEQVVTPTDEARMLVGELDDILAADYPPEQRFGLKFAAIFQPHVRFFIARLDGAPAGCGGVALFDGFAEVKRMYVRPALRGRGIVQALLARLEDEARRAGHTVLRLETGDQQHTAIRVYERAGFARCGAFGAYAEMAPGAIETSAFFEKSLARPV